MMSVKAAAGRWCLATTLLTVSLDVGAVSDDCLDAIHVERSGQYRIVADAKSWKEISPSFFGFNIEWVGFQDDLFDVGTSSVRPEIVDYMKAFEGAVYRYPGGTVANHFDWRASIGPPETRPSQWAVDWREPLPTLFGFDEYLAFVKKVNGRPWLVANIQGRHDHELDGAVLADSAAAWIAAGDYEHARLLGVELGNELDRGNYRWEPDRYSNRALLVANAIYAAEPSVRLVGMLQDYDANESIDSFGYNSRTSGALSKVVNDYALHLYYDGPPGGPPIPNRLRHLCESAKAVNAGTGRDGKIWVTEHARWPAGKVTDVNWKKSWHTTNDLEGAISVGDMMVALTQAPGVEGAFLHSLAGTYGPWPLFHKGMEQLHPSAVYWALKVLRQSVLARVLSTKTFSRNDSGYAGGYDLRATIFADHSLQSFALWAVNRSSREIEVRVQINELATQSVLWSAKVINDRNLRASNRRVHDQVIPRSAEGRLSFDSKGEALLRVPPYSISSVSFRTQASVHD